MLKNPDQMELLSGMTYQVRPVPQETFAARRYASCVQAVCNSQQCCMTLLYHGYNLVTQEAAVSESNFFSSNTAFKSLMDNRKASKCLVGYLITTTGYANAKPSLPLQAGCIPIAVHE